MLSGGMLASSLTLLLSLPVSVLFYLSPLVFAAWLWLLSLGLCPPGVLVTTLVNLCSLGEDMRSMYAFAPELSASSCLNAGPQLIWFPALFSFLVCRFPFRLAASYLSLYGLRHRATFVFCNSKCFSILYHLVFTIFFFFLTFCNLCFIIGL